MHSDAQHSVAASLAELDRLGWWYQHFKLPNGLWTVDGSGPAYLPKTRWNPLKPFAPEDLTAKTVLDLGGNTGYFSIQMKLRGAARCVLVDPFDEFLAQAEFATRRFGVAVELVNADAHVYCLSTQDRFDYVLLLGLLYHLKYPGLVPGRAAEMTRERIYIASAVIGPEEDDSCPSGHDSGPQAGGKLSRILCFPKWRSSRIFTTAIRRTGGYLITLLCLQ